MTILPYRVTLHGHDQNIVWLIAETLQMNRKKEETHRWTRIASKPSESLVTGVALRDQAAEWRWIRHHAAAAQLTLVKFHHGKFFLFCSGLGLSYRYIDVQLNKFTLESLHLTRYISIKLSCSGITNPKHSSLVWTEGRWLLAVFTETVEDNLFCSYGETSTFLSVPEDSLQQTVVL